MKNLSVITICYNEPNLEETCESIVNQTWQDFEWIVIDGGSNKETLDIFEKYKDRIDKFISEPDSGIYNAYNKGLKLATGKYLSFMNAGDCFYHNEVLNLFNCYVQNNKADIYYGECEYTFRRPDNSRDIVTNNPKTVSREFFILSNICTQGMFIAKDIFDEYGLFNENYKVCADYEKWLQAIRDNRTFEYLPIVVAKFDLNGISSNKKTRILTQSERLEIRSHFFSANDIKNVEENYKMDYSFLEQLFSIKNNKTNSCKIITLLGCHLKIKRSNK